MPLLSRKNSKYSGVVGLSQVHRIGEDPHYIAGYEAPSVPTQVSSMPALQDFPHLHSIDSASPALDMPASRRLRVRVARRLRFFELAIIAVACLAGSIIRAGLPHGFNSSFVFSVCVAGVLALMWIGITAANRTADGMMMGVGATEYRRILVAATVFLGVVALLQLVTGVQLSRAMLVITLSFGVFGCMLAHHLAGRSLKKNWRVGVGVARALVVVAPDRLPSVEGSLHDSDRLGLSVVAWLNGSELAVRSVDAGDSGGGWVPFAVECGPDPVDSILSAVDAMDADIVILADTSSLESCAFRDLSWALHERGVALAVEPAVGDVALSRMAMSQLNGTSLLQIDEPAYNRAMNLHKRLFDIVVSMMAMVLLSPVMISVALMVKLGDGGPILYGANRVGVGGKPMKMWKFRSMVTDAEARLKEVRAARGLDDDAFFKAEDDPRITRVGRVIRKTSIDELPQLFNVLKGEMSIVGPRPMVAGEGSQYVNFVERRVLVRPGMTGLWQVSGRSDITDDERVRLDLMYVENWSMTGDLAIIAKTFTSVLRMDGAY